MCEYKMRQIFTANAKRLIDKYDTFKKIILIKLIINFFFFKYRNR